MRITRLPSLAVFLLACLPIAAHADEAWTYSVKPGDSLIDIADGYLAKPWYWHKLQELNRVPEPKRLVPGTTLRIPLAWLKKEAAVAEVVRVQGDAQRVSGGAARALTAGDKLAAGEAIKTADGANVTLRFVDGSRLLVAQNTSLKLATMQVFGKTGMARTMVELNGGSVETQVSRQQPPAAKYEIKSEALNLGVRGTDFRVGVGEGGTTRSEVLAGRVMAAGTGKGVGLDAGFGTVAAPGKAPLPPVRLLEAPDLSATAARQERLPLRFGWNALPGADQYHAQVCADRSCGQLVLDGVFQQPAAKWGDLPDGKYVLRVRGIAANGLEGWHGEREFVLKARPEAPFVTMPLDGGKAYGTETPFRWARVEDALGYHLQLSATPDFARPLFDFPSIERNEHTLALEPGRYYWRIASVRAGNDQGPYSDVQGFTQRKIPESPSVEAPAVDEKALTFRWKAGEAGQKFHIQLARDKAFGQMVSDAEIGEPQFSLARPESGIYFMRIKAIDSDGFAGPFGPAQQIKVPTLFPAWLPLLIPLAFAL
ncbi:MAG: FecR domain-containing protein [Sulfuricella sp.]|nr:FecR domain-containing protein [Sulfuricella sp.]